MSIKRKLKQKIQNRVDTLSKDGNDFWIQQDWKRILQKVRVELKLGTHRW